MHLRSHKKKSFLEKMCLSLVFALFLALFLLFLVRNRMTSSIKKYATLESQQFAQAILNEAVRTETTNLLASKELYQINRNGEQEIETIDFNMVEANALLEKITKTTTDKLLALEDGNLDDIKVTQSFKGANFKEYQKGVVCEIPVGLLTDHFFFGNLGLLIPIRFSFVGTVDANLKSKVTPYGINNALVELFILVEVTEKISMPLASDQVKLSLEVPLVSQMVTGKIPTYYQGALQGTSNIFTVPLKEK